MSEPEGKCPMLPDVSCGREWPTGQQHESEPPERPYACDKHNGSYLDEPTQREVEKFTPSEGA